MGQWGVIAGGNLKNARSLIHHKMQKAKNQICGSWHEWIEQMPSEEKQLSVPRRRLPKRNHPPPKDSKLDRVCASRSSCEQVLHSWQISYSEQLVAPIEDG